MRSLVFEGQTWLVYEKLRENGWELHKALRRLLKEMLRGDPGVGAGKPEQLKHGLAELWTRRIGGKDRLIISFDESHIYSIAIGGHYDQPPSA